MAAKLVQADAFVIVFVMSPLITLIKCLKGDKLCE